MYVYMLISKTQRQGAAKNEAVAAGGRNEMETGNFTRGTREKEVGGTGVGGVGGSRVV